MVNWVLAVDLDEAAITDYEWVQDIGYREWLIPAAVVNAAGPVTVVEQPPTD